MARRRGRTRFGAWRALLPALALGGLLAPSIVTAQEATPGASPAAMGEPFVSRTADEFEQEIVEHYQIEPPGNTDGVFIQATVGDIQSLNPFLAEEETSITVTGFIFEGLIGGDPRTGEPAPGALSDWWEVAADQITYTFHLDPDARWHDGVDLTADDIIFSLDALANEETGSTYTGSFLDVAASWTKIDDDTVQIVSNGARVDFLYGLFGVAIVPKHIWESVPYADWRADPASTGQDPSRVIGTGPFKFGEWKQGEEIRLLRNDNYHDVVPAIREYVLRIFADQAAAVNAFLNGEIDTAALPSADYEAIKDTPGFNFWVYPERGFVYYEFNLDPAFTTLFEDRRVRQAFMWALDRESIVRDILLGYGEVADGTQPSISYAYAPDRISTIYRYNPDRARELLAEAGWTDSNGNGSVDKDGQEMDFEFLYPSGSPEYDSMVAYFQDAWGDVGIKITPRALEFNALIEATTTNPAFYMALYGFGWSATFIQDPMFGCDQYQVGFNDMRYCNPELDAIFDQAEVTLDQEARRELLIQAANIVNEDQPVGILYFDVSIVGASDRVRNYFPGAWGGPGVNYIWIEE